MFFSSSDDSAKQVKIQIQTCLYRPLSVVVKDIAVGVGGSPLLRRFFFSEFEIVFHRRRDGLRHSIHASA